MPWTVSLLATCAVIAAAAFPGAFAAGALTERVPSRGGRKLKQFDLNTLPPGCSGTLTPYGSLADANCVFGPDVDGDGQQDWEFAWVDAEAFAPDQLGAGWAISPFAVFDRLGTTNFDDDGNFLGTGVEGSPFVPGVSFIAIGGDLGAGVIQQEWFPDSDLIYEWLDAGVADIDVLVGGLEIEAELLPYALDTEGFQSVIGYVDVSFDAENFLGPFANFYPFNDPLFTPAILGFSTIPDTSIFSYVLEWPENISGRFASNVFADVAQAVYASLLG